MAPLIRKLDHLRSVVRFYARPHPFRFCLLLGHMRSGSSLLVHLLNAHPELAGFGEAHMSYRSARDLWLLHYRIGHALERPVARETRYLVDKFLHNKYSIAPRFLSDPRFRFLFLLREPRATLASLRKLLREVPEFDTPAKCLAHYVDRVEALRAQAATIAEADTASGRRRALFLTHAELLDETRASLDAIGRFLGLATPLPETYEATPVTGRSVFGDTSAKIHSGEIVRESEPPDLSEFSETELATAEDAFTETSSALGSLCERKEPLLEATPQARAARRP